MGFCGSRPCPRRRFERFGGYVVAKLRAQGFEPLGGPHEEFARFIARETVKWGAAAEAAGLKK